MTEDLLVKYLVGEADGRERLQVESWIGEDAANARRYRQLKLIWEESLKLAQESTADEGSAWERFRARAAARSTLSASVREDIRERIPGMGNVSGKKNVPEKEAMPGKKTVVSGGRRYGSWFRAAAVLAALAVFGWLTFYLVGNGGPGRVMELASGGNVLEKTLPDGSKVTLNRNTLLRYPAGFRGEERSVSLQGEAFFNVQPDKSKPFVIRVNDVTVRVTGTSFNVRSREDITEVIVETGVVEVSKDRREVEVRPGEKATARRNSPELLKEATAGKLYNYYRTREFVCQRTPLQELVEVLNEAYGVQIQVADPGLRELPITTVFKDESLEHILTVISETFDITVQKEENRILLKR